MLGVGGYILDIWFQIESKAATRLPAEANNEKFGTLSVFTRSYLIARQKS